ncbi:MAG: hypothetical protein R6U98_17780 [Pirellulaceae bacterium]
MRLHEIAHQIEHLLFMVDVVPEHRLEVLDYVKAGFDSETGEYQERSPELQAMIHCIDCEYLGGECPPECSVRQFRGEPR